MGVHSSVWLVPVVALASCAMGDGEPTLSDVEQGIRCDPEFCTTNSPLISVYQTWEFKLDGTPNDQGFALLGLGKDHGSATEFFTLHVENSQVFGLDAWGNVALKDTELVGTKIFLDHNGTQHAIVISAVGAIDEVVYPGRTLQSYVLDWSDVLKRPLSGPISPGTFIENNSMPTTSTPTAVCPAPKWIDETYVGSMVEWEETTYAGMSVYESLVFEGDRFDPEKRVVGQKPDNNWFNIGCGAHTLAKLRLTRNTIKTAPSWTNVQAAFKMLSADYCGTGTAFTFPGEPIVWRDRTAMTYSNLNPFSELEARWDQNGAICINSPRLARSGNPLAASTYPDVWDAIRKECAGAGKRLRKCSDLDPNNWQSSYELVTNANYD